MIVGYEVGRRLEETERERVGFPRVETFENWFLASAPGNPVLLRALEIIREKFIWKVQYTVDFTGPGSLSDAVHEFLAASSEEHGISTEVSGRTGQYSGKLSFPSERKYESGDLRVWLLSSGRVASSGYGGNDDPAASVIQHQFAGSWKEKLAMIENRDFVLVSK
eukprot:s9_g69.t1